MIENRVLKWKDLLIGFLLILIVLILFILNVYTKSFVCASGVGTICEETLTHKLIEYLSYASIVLFTVYAIYIYVILDFRKKVLSTRRNIYKNQFIDIVSEKSGLEREKCSKFMHIFLNEIIANVNLEEKVELDDFGTFKVYKVSPYDGVNPSTLEKMTVKEHNVIKFLPGNDLIESVNRRQ